MSKWSDLMARLRGKTASTDEPSPSQPPPPPAKSADESPQPALSETGGSQESSEDVMQQTHESNPEASPRQALSGGDSSPDAAAVADTDHRLASISGWADAAARLYGRALLEMADESNQLDEVASQVSQLRDLLRQPEGISLVRLMSTPALGLDDRRDLIDRVFKGRVGETLYRFMQIVNNKGRLATLPAMLAVFERLLDEKKGIVDVDVQVAQRLPSDEADAVAGRLSQSLGKQVNLHQRVDESLIGGLVIRVGDQLIDGSVATQLRSLRKNLVEAGRSRARQGAGIEAGNAT